MPSYKVLGLIVLLSAPAFSSAEMIINEIMYDLSGSDSGREWVEIYNNGSSSVDISGWKFLESSGASNHGLTQNQGVSLIPAGGFAVISSDPTKFIIDWPSFSGNLFKASFSSLNNTSSTVILKSDSSTTVDQVSYNSSQGANGDGGSLQKVNSNWVLASPTPGLQNSGVTISSSNATTTTDTATTTSQTTGANQTSSQETSSASMSAHSSPAPLSEAEEKLEFEISAGRDRLAMVGSSIIFRAVPTKFDKIPESGITYIWSFGDGTVSQGNNINHAYKFAGDYAVIVNASHTDRQAVSRTQVRVVSPSISLGRVSGGLEVTNKSSVEINLEGWSLVGNKKTFIFLKDTLISSGKKVIFADEVTGMSDSDTGLFNPAGKEFANFVSEIPLVISAQVATITSISLDDIQAKLSDAKDRLVQLYPSLSIKPQVAKVTMPKPLPVTESILATSNSTSTSILLDARVNTAMVFQAEEQVGLVSSIFSWPIKGFGFIKRLFVED